MPASGISSELSSHQMAFRSHSGVFHCSLLLQHSGMFGPALVPSGCSPARHVSLLVAHGTRAVRWIPPQELPCGHLKPGYASPTSLSSEPWRWTPPGDEVVYKVSLQLLDPLSQSVVLSAYFVVSFVSVDIAHD